MKIAIIVPGRFDAFGLAQALTQQGHKVGLFTNYPKWAVRRFGVCPTLVRSFWLHGVFSRIAWFLRTKINFPYPEAWLSRMFGNWSAQAVTKTSWDIVLCWSGVSEEILSALRNTKTLKIVMRGSSHIRTQARILREEARQYNIPINYPSQWIIGREEREYALTDYIRVLSTFAYNSFVDEGIQPQKLLLIPSAVSVRDFRPSQEIIKARCLRIENGAPLRILYVGAISFRKGIKDMVTVISALNPERFRYRFVGPEEVVGAKETRRALKELRHRADIIPKRPQHQLPKYYAWADLFIFPTLEDGFAVVLAQAQAAGLPIIATANCAAPDIIIEGKTGWVVPIRTPEAFIERLKWCDSQRKQLVRMVNDVYEKFQQKDWSDIAKEFARRCQELIRKHKLKRIGHLLLYSKDK
ncbi:MAG: glycosyltransferase family 4 protein [Candidatus Omnitrophota bacterium]|nr:MAG: glycosyltransferase family 4 protein [Candidatus Omnitrophota bacterium]